MTVVDIIKERLDIATVVSKYVKLEKRGANLLGLCPFHKEKSPSFSVSGDGGYYHCFGCKKSGDLFNFLMEIEKKDFSEVLEELAKQLGVEIPKKDSQRENEKSDHFLVMESAKKWYAENLNKLQNKRAKDYFLARGFFASTIEIFELGFAQDARSQLSDFLLKQRISKEQILTCGLAICDEQGKLVDRFKNRVIFPIYNEKKQLVGFGGRLIEPGNPKYLNSPETEFFKKKEILYNLDKAKDSIRKSAQAYVVEGYVDVISLAQAGFSNVVATLGTALTLMHLEKLWKYTANPTICLDGDEAGRAAVYRSAHLVLEHIAEGKSVDFILLPSGMDPDEMLKTKGPEYMAEVLSKKINLSDLIWEFELSKLTKQTPEEVAMFESNLMLLANKIKNNNVRAYYIKFFKDKLWHQFKKTRSNSTRATPNLALNNLGNISENLTGVDQAILSLVINNPEILLNKQIFEEFCAFKFMFAHSELIRSLIIALAEKTDLQNLTKKHILESLHANNIELKDDKINLHTNIELCVTMWNVAIKKHLVENIENEYKRLILRQDEGSFDKAKILRDEVIKLKEEICKLQSEIEEEQFQ